MTLPAIYRQQTHTLVALAGMKTLSDPQVASELQARIANLQPDTPNHWGTMNPAQALAHCSAGFDLAIGTLRPPRKIIGRLLGALIKPLVFRDNAPMRRNTPTLDGMHVLDDRNFEAERNHLSHSIDRFLETYPSACTNYPHAYFGRLTPEEWSILLYKHLDHHLRQFGA